MKKNNIIKLHFTVRNGKNKDFRNNRRTFKILNIHKININSMMERKMKKRKKLKCKTTLNKKIKMD